MPIFAPVYRPTKHQHTFLARQQRIQRRKRKRGEDSSDDEDGASQTSAGSDPSPAQSSTPWHPVNKTDPYYVARHSREEPLPPPPFPHAAVKEPSKARVSIEEELAGLNPPLYVPTTGAEDKSTSLRRRHLDNLTTILHACMLKGDWARASRAWSLLLRTEIAGRGINVRRSGRWGIGAEILMRRGAQVTDSNGMPGDQDVMPSQFSDKGFKLAREYYERLILQYPHTQYTQHSLNATAIYPALFNVWIYEVQNRSKLARSRLSSSRPSSAGNSDYSMYSDASDDDKKRHLQQIQTEELEDAKPIASRMDELLLSPPYDTSASLLQLRGMVAMWIAELHSEFAGSIDGSMVESDRSSMDGLNVRSNAERHRNDCLASRQRARELFGKLERSGKKLPPQALDLRDEDSDGGFPAQTMSIL